MKSDFMQLGFKMNNTYIQVLCVNFRFKMQSRFNLKPVLQSLGISDVFSPSAADFRGISGRKVGLKTV